MRPDLNDRAKAGDDLDPTRGAKPLNAAAQQIEDSRILSLHDLFDRVLDDAKSERPSTGLSLGHYKLDKMLCGLRRGYVTTLGARTSFGKTSKALQITDLALRADKGVLYVNCEDSPMLFGRRLMAMRANVNALRLRANACTKEDIAKMEFAAGRAEKAPFFLNGIGQPVERLARRIREHCKDHDVALIVVDYLQKFAVERKSESRRTEVTYITNTLSDTIKSVDAAGLMLSQCARPSDKNKTTPPDMNELKESGDIENASEHVLIGHVEVREDMGETTRTRKISVKKNKDGPVIDEWIEMPFDEVTASFKEARGRYYDGSEPEDEA